MAQQTETLIIDVKEQGADQATSKVSRLNEALKKTAGETKGALDGLKGFGSGIADLASGSSDAAASVQELVLQAGSAASTFAQSALAAAVTGSALFDLQRANEAAAAATADLTAKEKAYAEAKAARDAIRGLPVAKRGSDEAADRAAIRENERLAYLQMKTAQFAKEAREADVATTAFFRNAAVGAGSLAAAAALAYTGLEVMAFRARALAEETDETARKLGITTERLQALQYVADGGAGTVEGLTRVFDKLGRSMQKADEDNAKTEWAFKSLGVSMEEVGRLSEEQLAVKLVKNYELLGRTTQSTVAIQQLLGPAFREQIPAILDLEKGLGDYITKVNDFGAVASPALVKAGQEQDDALKDLGLAWRGLGNEIAEQTGTIIKSITESLTAGLNAIRTFLAESRRYKEQVADIKTSISPERRKEITEQVRDEQRRRFIPQGNEAFAARRMELYRQEMSQTTDVDLARETMRANAALQAQQAAVRAAAAGAGNAPQKGGTKTDPFADAREGMRRQLALTREATEYERTLFEVQEGRYKALKPNQKDELLNLAKQIDTREALNQKAQDQLKLMQQYDDAEEEANNRLRERIGYERQLASEQAKRLSAAARATRMSSGIETRAGTTGSQKQEMADIANVANAAQDAISQLSPYLSDYAENVRKIREAEMEASDAIREAARSREKYAADWTNGAKDAFANYLEDAGNVAGKTQKLFEQSFGKAEDALVEFVTTGKFNFKGFVASILTDIARYLIQVSIMAPIIASLKAMMGFADGGVFSGGAPTAFAKGGAFSGGRVTPFANGGVVGSPTLFPMQGGGVGLMGEAGPEAIMPLDRDPMGRLGVKASGMGGVSNTYAINVSIGSVDSEERQMALIKAFESVVETKTKQTMANEMRRGNMLNRRM